MPDATPCSPCLSGTRSPRPLFRIAILALVKPIGFLDFLVLVAVKLDIRRHLWNLTADVSDQNVPDQATRRIGRARPPCMRSVRPATGMRADVRRGRANARALAGGCEELGLPAAESRSRHARCLPLRYARDRLFARRQGRARADAGTGRQDQGQARRRAAHRAGLSLHRRSGDISLLLEMVLGLVLRRVRARAGSGARTRNGRETTGCATGRKAGRKSSSGAKTVISSASSRPVSTASISTASMNTSTWSRKSATPAR